MKHRFLALTVLLVSASATLTACGGGGSSADPTDPAAVANGQNGTSPVKSSSASASTPASGSSSTQAATAAATSSKTPAAASSNAQAPTSSNAAVANSSSAQATTTAGGSSSSASAASPAVPFYGVNGHYVQGGVYSSNIPQQVADMKAMGMTSIRQDCYSTADTAKMASLVSSFAPIKIQPVFNIVPTTTDETTAYNQFYAYGQTVAGQLAGKVPVIELMNEPENMYFKNGSSNNGQNVTDWASSNSQWAAFRGAVRGFYAGFRAVDTKKQTLIASPSVGWLHYGILEGLWTGKSPDGSTGHATATWDITNYHWYYDFGDIENAGGVNTLAVIKGMFNRPIILSEIGVQTNVSSSAYNSYVASSIAEYASSAKTYNIIGIDWYELYNFQVMNGFYMGLYSSPGQVNAGRAAAVTTAVSSNPES